MQEALKVLMLIENCSTPEDNRVWAEAKSLRKRGCEVSIIGPRDDTKYQEPYACIEGIHIYRYRLPTGNTKMAYVAEYGIALLVTSWLSLKVLFRHGFDVIHSANPPDIFFLMGLFYKLLGKKFIFDQHDLAPEMFQVIYRGRGHFFYRLLRCCEYCSYRVSDIVITSSVSQKEFALKRGHCRPENVFVVRNGPGLQHLQIARTTSVEADLKKGRKHLLAYVGEINVQDGVENALYALHDLVYKRDRQDVSLVVMGDGEHLTVLRNLAHELQLEEYINFTGWIAHSDVLRFLATADIGVVPDPQNGLSEYCVLVKTMEYMGMGKPVVAFDLAETRHSAGNAALYARPNLVEDLANKIETLLDDENLCLHMGAIGRKRVEEELCWDYTQQYLLLAYQKLFPRAFNDVFQQAGSVLDRTLEIHR